MSTDELRRYLDRVEGHLAGSRKADILREIESHIWDRAEALAAARGGGAPEPEDLRRAMGELGEPSDLAVSYSGERHLVSPQEYASFWYFTGLVFAVHFTMLFLAVVTKARFNIFPFNVLPEFAGGRGVLTLVSLAVQAFLFDAGLVLVVFFLLRRTFRRVDLPNLTFRVETSRRPSLVRAVFALVLAMLLGIQGVRENVFSVRIPGEDPHASGNLYSLFLPAFFDILPFVLAFLILSLVKDVLYAFFHERPWTVALDALAWIAGVALCILLFSRNAIIGLPSDFPLEEGVIGLFNAALGRLLGLFLILLAALFASRAVKRIVRLVQIWGEKEAASL